MRGFILAGAALASITSPPTYAEDAGPLSASSKWQADFGKTECRLLRTFGEGQDRVTLQFSQIDPDPVVAVSLSAPRIPATDGRKPSKILVASTSVDVIAQGFPAQSGAPPILEFQPSHSLRRAMVREAEAGQPTRLGIEFVRGWMTTLDLGGLKSPLATLDRCVDGMVKSWGLDPVEQRARRAGPTPKGGAEKWFKGVDFPRAQARKGSSGVVIARLIVDAQGAVTDCEAAKSGGDQAFQDVTCRLLRERARFNPAKGAAGQPIASFWTTRINWVLGPTGIFYLT